MASYTPGPWFREEDGLCIVSESVGAAIGSIHGSDDFPCLEFDSEEAEAKFNAEASANADLFASCPQLLAGLVALAAWSDHPHLTGLTYNVPVPNWVPCFDDTCRMIDRAIKLATGKTIGELAREGTPEILATFAASNLHPATERKPKRPKTRRKPDDSARGEGV